VKTHTVIIRRFGLGPLAQWGFIAGAIVACLPAFFCSWVLFSLVTALSNLIAGWQNVGFQVLGQKISFNLIQLLNLQQAQQTLTGLAGFGVFGIVLLALGIALLLGVFGALVMTLLGAFYNATGRLQLELEETEENAQRV